MSRNRDLGEFPAAALDIDAAGNVGIGTSSPAYELDVNGQINIADGMNIRCEGHILIGKSTGDEIRVGSGNVTDILKLYAGGPERMRIDLNGNVGIGTISPSATLELNSASQNAAKLRIGRSTAHDNYLQLDTAGGESQLTAIGASSVYGSMIFSRNNGATTSESMRIDSSGNLLVGTTTVPASGNTTGFRVDESGYISLTGAGTSAIDANRMGSDGPVINIRKDGTTSGNIGVSASGTEVYLAGSGGNTSGIFCSNGNALLSMKAGVLANGTQDLGSPSYRFNDLYLAGSIQSSGGATNILGTTTVFSASNFSITTSAQTVVPRSDIPTLPTGVYLMTIYLSGGGWYSSYISGLVQHYNSTTNSSSAGGPNTIHLTAAGHAQNSGVLYARYQTTLGNNDQHGVQIWSSTAVTVNAITISWKRLS